MEKRTEYTLIAIALISSGLVGAAIGITAQQPLNGAQGPLSEPQPTVTITQVPAPKVVVLDGSRAGGELNNDLR